MNKFLTTLFLVLSSTTSYSADMLLPIRGIADGDTIKTTVALPCPLCQASVRIRGIDTPESNHLAKCDKEKHAGLQAKDYLIATTRGQTEMMARNMKWDKYGGRIDAEVEINGVDIGKDMINRGFAKPYTGQGPKANWCK